MNRSGKLVVPIKYDHGEYTDDEKIKMELNDKVFYFDEIHGKLTEFPSSSITRRI